MVGCFVMGSALRMAAMLGYTPRAPEMAQQWLNWFRDEALLAERHAQGATRAHCSTTVRQCDTLRW